VSTEAGEDHVGPLVGLWPPAAGAPPALLGPPTRDFQAHAEGIRGERELGQRGRSLHAYLIDTLGAHTRGDPAALLA
jgi:hypothetical protein